MRRRLLSLAAGTAFVANAPAYPQEVAAGMLFQCDVKSYATLVEDGELGPGGHGDALARLGTKFVFDASSQVLRWQGGNIGWQYQLVQTGDVRTNLISLRVFEGTATAVVSVLQIQVWRPQWPFLLTEQDLVYSGTCERY